MRLGAHVSISGGKFLALERGKNIGCESIQIFVRNVRGWVSKPLEKKEIEKFHEMRIKINDIWPIISHNSYLINLASLDEDKLNHSYDAMIDELIKCDLLGIEYVNMHPGVIPKADKDNITKKEALNQIAEKLNELFEETKNSKVIILLETTAGQGKGLGNKFHHFKTIIDKVTKKDRIGICFDTSHSYAAGYDFTSKKNYEQMWEDFNEIIGLRFLKAFHLNDSIKELGSRVDRHEHIGKGKIGKKPFEFFINDERFKDLPGILETPDGDEMFEKNLTLLKSLRYNRQ